MGLVCDDCDGAGDWDGALKRGAARSSADASGGRGELARDVD